MHKLLIKNYAGITVKLYSMICKKRGKRKELVTNGAAIIITSQKSNNKKYFIQITKDYIDSTNKEITISCFMELVEIGVIFAEFIPNLFPVKNLNNHLKSNDKPV